MGFQTRDGLKNFLENTWNKTSIRTQLWFLSHIVCHSFQVCELHNEVSPQSVFKWWSWHLGQINKKGLTLKPTWWNKGLSKAYLSTLNLRRIMVYLFTEAYLPTYLSLG
jgi:hypothetical protein